MKIKRISLIITLSVLCSIFFLYCYKKYDVNNNTNNTVNAENAINAEWEEVNTGGSQGEQPEYDEDKDLSREEIQEKYNVFESAAKYLMDPEELTDKIIEGIHGSRFAPFSETAMHSKKEWEELMTQHYGEEWEKWIDVQ